MKKTYFTQVRTDDGSFHNELLTAAEIIHRVSMSDCSEEEFTVFDSAEFGTLIPLNLLGTWHNPNDPLLIKALDPDGHVVFSGYGEDH